MVKLHCMHTLPKIALTSNCSHCSNSLIINSCAVHLLQIILHWMEWKRLIMWTTLVHGIRRSRCEKHSQQLKFLNTLLILNSYEKPIFNSFDQKSIESFIIIKLKQINSFSSFLIKKCACSSIFNFLIIFIYLI